MGEGRRFTFPDSHPNRTMIVYPGRFHVHVPGPPPRKTVRRDSAPVPSAPRQMITPLTTLAAFLPGWGWAVGEQALPLHGLGLSSASLATLSEALPVEANAFSPACNVTSALVPAATLDELAAADLTGNIALLYGDLVSEPLSPKSWFLRGERDDAIIGLLETKRPAALLAPPPPTPQYEQFTGDWELEIPAATVPVTVVERLLNCTGPLSLHLECAKRPATARNIVAHRPGAPIQRRPVESC